MSKKLSTDSYKGVRDFYPAGMAVQNFLFKIMREIAERFGYVEYGASILEPAELYENKTSEEIVREQTYTFTDRGERKVTLRPEMTPTVVRMIAAQRHELAFPLRWYSIQNVFRYERPQRGRLREHWQLNCDLFGVPGVEAEVEIITLAYQIMKRFGASDEDFEIRINSRALLQTLVEPKLTRKDLYPDAVRLIDRKEKMSQKEFEAEWKKLSETPFELSSKPSDDVQAVLEKLQARGINNVHYFPTLTRGFDYYTGIVFEVFDRNPENRRSLFGGGRYDSLLELFDQQPIPAVGFGMGDVTMRDFLETRRLLPEYRSTTTLYIIPIEKTDLLDALRVADTLRAADVNVALDLSDKKVGDKIKLAVKQSIPYVLFVGNEETKNKAYKLKNLLTQEEKTVAIEEVENICHA